MSGKSQEKSQLSDGSAGRSRREIHLRRVEYLSHSLLGRRTIRKEASTARR